MLIDTHCHVYESEMENACSIIRRAGENDIRMIVNGTDPKSNLEVLELADRFGNVHAALGYFPTFAGKVTDEDISLLESQLRNENVVAVGEIGLDYYHGKDDRQKQMDLFEEMLGLAESRSLPVIVHCRKAMQDAFDILKAHDVAGSMHCYQGSAEMARQFAELGFYMGVGGPVTHPSNKKVRKALSAVGISRILVETDSPYLSPQEKRDEQNTPMNLGYIISRIAEELDMEEGEVAGITCENARVLFKI